MLFLLGTNYFLLMIHLFQRSWSSAWKLCEVCSPRLVHSSSSLLIAAKTVLTLPSFLDIVFKSNATQTENRKLCTFQIGLQSIMDIFCEDTTRVMLVCFLPVHLWICLYSLPHLIWSEKAHLLLQDSLRVQRQCRSVVPFCTSYIFF